MSTRPAPDLSAFTQNDFYQNEFLPAYQTLVGSKPTSAYHAQAFDAMGMIAAAITASAVDNDGALDDLEDRVQGRDVRDERVPGHHRHDHLHATG